MEGKKIVSVYVEQKVINIAKYIDDYLEEDIEPKKIIEYLRTDYGDEITSMYCGSETDEKKIIEMIKEKANEKSKKQIEFIENMEYEKKKQIVTNNKKRLNKYYKRTMKKLMYCDEKVHAEMFYEDHVDEVFITTTSGNAFVFNDDNCLFEEKIFAQMVIMVMNYLEAKVELCFKQVECEKDTKENDDNRINLQKARKKIRRKSHCKNVYELIIGMLYDPDFSKKINKIKNLLPIKKRRVIDLRTLNIRERTKEDMFSIEVDADFIENYDEPYKVKDENSKTKKVDKLIHIKDMVNKLFKGNQEIVTCFQKHCGYFITGETSEQGIYIIYGKGSNGKSSFFEILSNLLKTLYCVADKRVFMKTQCDSTHDTHILPLQNARVAVFQESDENGKFNSGQLKNLRGESKVTARGCGCAKETTFFNQSKLCLLTNEKPKFSIKDSGLIRSLRYFPFEAIFTTNPNPDETKGEYLIDPLICTKLSEDYIDEVLTWLCIGAKMFYEDREKYNCIQIPEYLKQKTKESVNEMDNSGDFLEEMCDTNGNYKTNRTDIYIEYSIYAEKNKI